MRYCWECGAGHPSWVHTHVKCTHCDNREVVSVDNRGWYLCAAHLLLAGTDPVALPHQPREGQQ